VSQPGGKLAARLNEIVAEFSDLEPRERLELLLEFAESLPPLPPDLLAERDVGEHRVHECQTPVFVWVKLEAGLIRISADVAPEAPTVKGFVAILADLLNGAAPDEVLALEPTLVHRLGLSEALGMMRMRGLQAIQFYIRKQVRVAADQAG